MFYDIYCDLCRQSGLTPSGAAARIGFNRASVTVWKNTGKAPKQDLLVRIADYFGVTTDFLLGKEIVDPEEELHYDEFTYAMKNEAKTLTNEDKQLLLSMARQLRNARSGQRD